MLITPEGSKSSRNPCWNRLRNLVSFVKTALRSYYVPNTVLSILHILIHLVPNEVGSVITPNGDDEKTEAKRVQKFVQDHPTGWQSQDLNPGSQPGHRIPTLNPHPTLPFDIHFELF